MKRLSIVDGRRSDSAPRSNSRHPKLLLMPHENMHQRPEIINPLEYPLWDDLLLSTGQYSFFHTSAWARVLHESYNYTPLYFSIIKSGRLLFSMPVMEVKGLFNNKRGVALPFTDYCEPIIAENIKFEELLGHLVEYAREAGWKYVEIRGGKELLGGSEPSQYYYVHDMDITLGEKEIFSNFKNNTKRNIKKAAREGVRVETSSSIESIQDFYRLNCITRKSHGLPPQPYFFFKKIHEHIISKGHGSVILASYEGKKIAGAVYFHFGKRAIYKYGASDIAYQHLRANNLVMWESIKRYAAEGYHNFSFGRTEPGNAGLRRFKTGWGAKEEKIFYYKYSLAENAFVKDKPLSSGLRYRICTKLPIPILRFLGGIAYKYQG